MGPFDDLDQQAENEFQQKCREFAMYQPVERTTLDGEWTEEELKSDIYDVCVEVMTDKVLSQYKYRALRDSNLLKLQYMAEHIADQIDDVIELYNKEYDKHREQNCFGIHWYDEAIKGMIMKELKGNVIK